MLGSLFRRLSGNGGGFPGGVHPPQQKLTAASPIEECPLPPVLILPVKQHIGEVCAPLVDVGDHVLRGQKIAKSQGYVSVPVHASTSGTVVKLEEHPVPHPSGLGRLCIFIEPDGKDGWDTSLEAMPDYREQEASVVRDRVRLGGIAGLGGAVFPSFIKLHDHRHPVDTVILNGIECEPYLTTDHRLMLERAEEIVRGLDVIMHVSGAGKAIIAVEDNKPDAADAMREALGRFEDVGDISVKVLPTKYPQGGEKQLIQALTGREVPSGKLPVNVGILCHNVGTARAIHDAVVLGRPLTERVVTVSGDAVPRPANASVRLGTPMPFLLAHYGLEDLDGVRVVHGGPMMGESLSRTDVPVVKSTNGVLAMQRDGLYSEHAVEQPCIRCGQCVQACPAGLVPNELAWHCRNDQFDRGQQYDLFECIECGCCSYVCPSHIPLVHYFRYAKGQVAKIEQERAFAEQSKARNEARDNRLAREQAERAAKRSKAKQKQRAATEASESATEEEKA